MSLWRAILPLFLLGFASKATAAPITTSSATPIANGQFIARTEVIRQHADTDNIQFYRDSVAATLIYGINPNLAAFVTNTYKQGRLNDHDHVRHNSGFSDTSAFLRYTAYQSNRLGKTLRVAPYAGMQIPTGQQNVSDQHGELPVGLQTGHGTVNPFAGLTLTYATLNWRFDSQVRYQFNNFEIDDEWRVDTSLQYRVLPTKLSTDTNSFVNAVLEFNYINHGRDQMSALNTGNSSTLFIAPGLQYVRSNFIAEASVQIPMSTRIAPGMLEQEYIARVGVRLNF
jgi:hypothetical protein